MLMIDKILHFRLVTSITKQTSTVATTDTKTIALRCLSHHKVYHDEKFKEMVKVCNVV